MWSVEFVPSGIKMLLPDSESEWQAYTESKLIWNQQFWFKSTFSQTDLHTTL